MRRAVIVAAATLSVLAACTSAPDTSGSGASTAAPPAPAGQSADPALGAAVTRVVTEQREKLNLRAVLYAVRVDGREIVTGAVGESMTGVPATPDMYVRNGSVAEAYMSTLLLRLVDEGVVTLDDRLSTWLPDFPHSDEVTLRQLAQMTSGYVDYEQLPELTEANYAAPFKAWTPEELLAYMADKPLWYPPGTNWNYAHTNYLLLGLALEKITGQDLATALRERVLDPLGLIHTTDPGGTAVIPEPVLHTFSSERRQQLQVPATVPFYEETTYWDPSWTFARGAIQTSNLADLLTTAERVFSGELLTPESYAQMVTTDLRGKTSNVPGCPGTCFDQSAGYTYGLGIVTTGNWLVQDPLFSGESAVAAYLPSQKAAIAVAVTYTPEAFDPTTGAYQNLADRLWRAVAAEVVPTDPPPTK
jgi:CubicO group peptidase (beta-lactamase class C family)